MAGLKTIIKAALPKRIAEAYRRYMLRRMHRWNASRSTEQVFTEIYAQNLWGGKHGTFSSGSGSTDEIITAPYVSALRGWLQENGAATKTVVDLGCGDFRLGSRYADLCGHYIGVDIVGSLVQRNAESFGNARVQFRKLDIIDDPLPDGDICILRQVLQHLSNAQIARVLPKLSKYPLVLITEHQPSPQRMAAPNIDKPHGADIRIYENSGVFLDREPFFVPAERLKLLIEVPGHDLGSAIDPGVIRTFVMANVLSD